MVKSSRLMVVLLPSRVSSVTFHLEQPAGANRPCGGISAVLHGLESRKLNALVTQPEREYPLAVGAIRIEGVSHENAHAQN